MCGAIQASKQIHQHTEIMKITKVAYLLILYPLVGLALESRRLGDLEMRIRSRSNGNKDAILLDILTVTVSFLDERFKHRYSQSDNIQFDKVSLSAVSYDLDEVNGGYLAILLLRGNAFFQKNRAPGQREVLTYASSFFQEDNQVFLDHLMRKNNKFLSEISYAIVRVDGDVVAENDKHSSIESNTSPTTKEKMISMEMWIIGVVAGLVGFVTVSLICLVCICCCQTVEVDVRDKPVAQDVVVRNAPTRPTLDDDSYQQRDNPPSPLRSITSQDSSVFTFNPLSCKSFESKTLNSFLTTNTGVDIDVEAWQQGSKVPKDTSIFGHDISVIDNKKDLSLIEEGNEGDDMTPAKISENQMRIFRESRPLTQNALEDLDRADRRAHRKNSRSSTSSARSSSASANSWRQTHSAHLDDEAADVIDDLNDLSYQIDQYRRRSHGLR